MTERTVREALRAVPVDPAARERSRRVIRAGLASRAPARSSRRRWVSTVVLVGLLALASVGIAAARAPDSGLGRWVRDVLGVAPHPRRALVRVPGGGRLLVQASSGTWVVSADGAMRRLGAFDGASWSPQGRFVVAWRDGQLTAVDPRGHVRWSFVRPQRVEAARWAPVDGFRIAYLAGGSVRIVNGDGTGDHALAAARPHVAAAWRPGAGHVLAYVDARDRVTVVAVDGVRRLWRSAPIAGVRRLAWAAAGDRLAVVGRGGVMVLGRDGAVSRALPSPPGVVADDAAWSPRGGRLALVRTDRELGTSRVVALDPAREARGRVLFSGAGPLGPIAWSPDGRRVLVPWPAAGQWLFLRADGRRPVAVAGVAAQFAPGVRDPRFPRSALWCCAATR